MGIASTGNLVSRTVTLCFVTALFEGLDIQSMGVAAPKLAPAFHLGPGSLGLVMSASTFGLMLGAAGGGWLSDRFGRKAIIVLSMLALGIFSLATTVAVTVPQLVLIRVCAGLGLGGAFPTLIALVSEITAARLRVTALACMYCGMPLGGIGAGLVATFAPSDWHNIFYAGGLGPLLLVPILAGGLPGRLTVQAYAASDRAIASAHSQERISQLFGSRATTTVLLWTAYFFTLLVVYLLLNWLPSLTLGRGYTHAQAATSSIVLNCGAVVGSLILGYLSDRGRAATILTVTYVGMIVSLLMLASPLRETFLPGAFAAGFFVIGGQLVLYALAPTLYPQAIRGTGVGVAVAVGRIGSIAGPLLAGSLLSSGFGPGVVPAAAVPGLAVGWAALLWLLRREADSRACSSLPIA